MTSPVAAGKVAATRGNSNVMDPIGGRLPLAENRITLGVDLPHDAFLAGGKEGAPIRRKGQRKDGTFMTAHDAHHPTDRGLPDPHCPIIAAACALRFSGHERTERETCDGVGMLAKGTQQLPIGG